MGGLSYPGAATVAGLVQLEGARAAWKLSLNFFLSYNYFSLLSYFFIAFSFLSRKSNVMVKCVTEVTQRLDVDGGGGGGHDHDSRAASQYSAPFAFIILRPLCVRTKIRKLSYQLHLYTMI